MGMAASQARYLALTARKTNTEWEGQQINQARTALANQSANLFNRLLGLEVPNPPKTTDYTELQYSYSDGENESVLESWKQLSNKDNNYNYEVKHYYLADVYTGAQKMLQDPQVQMKNVLQEKQYNSKDTIVEFNATDNVVTVKYKVKDEDKSQAYDKIDVATADDNLKLALKDFGTAKHMAMTEGGLPLNTDDIYGYQDTDGTWHFFLYNNNGAEDYKDYSTVYAPAYVGNSKLTELNELVVNDKIDQVAELAQILKDTPTANLSKHISFDADGNLQYTGSGIYTFDMNGRTYYTTQEDLDNSVGKPYNPLKPIEQQQKLAYFNASYISKKIEETNHALLETDSNGRFKSVRFDNDTNTYNLNVETVTNEKAYQDAMNQYLYKKEQYEKTIADINAKTEIIQQEDRTLELRLKQLDTEQHALATEMDAVKKVIKDNVEKTFKTFGD